MDGNSNSRINNSLSNLAFSLGGKVIELILKFVLRTVFIHTLSTEYLGLGGLFTNILSLLSLAELGVGTAITFSLYKPIAENNKKQLAILMRLYKKVYIAIGFFVLVVGAVLTPFLDFFINDMPNIPYIRVIYLLFVINSGVSYFYSYKSSFIIANQKSFVVTNNTCLMNAVCAICQVTALYVFRDYLFYLIIQVVFTIIANIRISIIADKMYPVLRIKSTEKLDTETKNTILANMGAMVFHKIGQIIVFSTDNILLSKLFGLLIVGLYSNYTMIVNMLEGILCQFFSSIAASIGNLGVDADHEHQNEVFYVIFFLDFWMFSFSTIALGTIIQPFIILWVGNDYLMSTCCVAFIVINFYLKGMRQATMTFDTSYGLMRYYKYMPIPECLVNLIFSVVFAKVFGPIGIFAGTTLSTIIAPFWIEPHVLFKYGLKSKISKYISRYIIYALFTGVVFIAINYALSFESFMGIWGLIIRLLCVLIVPNVLVILAFHRTSEYKYLFGVARKILRKKCK